MPCIFVDAPHLLMFDAETQTVAGGRRLAWQAERVREPRRRVLSHRHQLLRPAERAVPYPLVQLPLLLLR